MSEDEPAKVLPPWELPEYLAGVAREQARWSAETEAAAERRFMRERQRLLAAERAERRAALQRGELVIDPPSTDDGPEIVGVWETRVESMLGAPRWARDARNEALRILLDGALALSGAGLRVEGRPAGKAPVERVKKPSPRPVRAKTTTKPPKPRKAPQKAAKPKVRPAPKPRPERPAPPDEVRCTAMNSRGLRCRMEAVLDGKCLLHSGA